MIDTDKWIESARISLDELEKEVNRLRETIKAYLDLDMDSLEFCRIMREMGVIE